MTNTEPPDVAIAPSATGSNHSARQLVAAALVLVVAAAGATWWLATGRSERIDTGPADTTMIDPVVLDERGIYRLPDPDSDFKVVQAGESGVDLGFQMAVDDPKDPTRWLMLVPASVGLETSNLVSDRFDLPGGTTAVAAINVGADNATWIQVTGEDSTGYLTVAFSGIDRQPVIEMLSELVERIGNLTDVERVNSALRYLDPPDGLQPAWDPDRIGQPRTYSRERPVTSLGLSLVRLAGAGDNSDSGTEIGVGLQATGLAPQVALLQRRLLSEAPTFQADSAPEQGQLTTTPRPDLGEHVLLISRGPLRELVAATDDGVLITVSNLVAMRTASAAGAGGSEQDELPPGISVEEQAGVISSLHAMDAGEFREELDRRGAEFLTAETLAGSEGPATPGAEPPSIPTAEPTTTIASTRPGD